ncbi:MAG: bifunctional nuclease family protein [Verrucomicrobiae bacterium]|nr:bifunctional nuclease family protein [Verrucomicrobiae bacterium]
MKNGLVPIQVHTVLPTPRGCAVFLGNDEKTFVIFVDSAVGQAILMHLKGAKAERPMTHELIDHIFTGFGVTTERVVINDLKKDTYFARLLLRQQNELGAKIVELDARPSDCLALALSAKAPIFVAKHVFDAVQDRSDELKEISETLAKGATALSEDEDDSEEEGEPPEPDDDGPAKNPDVDEPPPDEPSSSKA